MKCPVCGNDTFDDNNDIDFDICPECYWEYDKIQVADPDMAGGANCHSLNGYRKIYLKLKAENPNFSCTNEADRKKIVALDHNKNVIMKNNSFKVLIVYASIHHGNTKKVVDALTEKYTFETVDATKVKNMDLSQYDVIGFASGVYAFNLHQSIIEFASTNLPSDKKVFIISTSAMNKDFSGSLVKIIDEKKCKLIGKYSCFGYNTFGPFKLVGGTSKGHPDQKDIDAAIQFYADLNI